MSILHKDENKLAAAIFSSPAHVDLLWLPQISKAGVWRINWGPTYGLYVFPCHCKIKCHSFVLQPNFQLHRESVPPWAINARWPFFHSIYDLVFVSDWRQKQHCFADSARAHSFVTAMTALRCQVWMALTFNLFSFVSFISHITEKKRKPVKRHLTVPLKPVPLKFHYPVCTCHPLIKVKLDNDKTRLVVTFFGKSTWRQTSQVSRLMVLVSLTVTENSAQFSCQMQENSAGSDVHTCTLWSSAGGHN